MNFLRSQNHLLSPRKKHLSSVLVSNDYPLSFLQKLTTTRKPCTTAEPAYEFKSTAVLTFVTVLSEQLRHCLQQQGVRAVFKLETTLRSHLIRPKDAVDSAKQDGVAYRIPCEGGKVHSARLEDLCETKLRSMTETSDSPVPRPPPFQSTPTTPDTAPASE